MIYTIFRKGACRKTAKTFHEPCDLPECHVPSCQEAADYSRFDLGSLVRVPGLRWKLSGRVRPVLPRYVCPFHKSADNSPVQIPCLRFWLVHSHILTRSASKGVPARVLGLRPELNGRVRLMAKIYAHKLSMPKCSDSLIVESLNGKSKRTRECPKWHSRAEHGSEYVNP